MAAELKAIHKLSLNYKATGRIAWNENNITGKISLKNLAQNIGLYYFPNKDIDLSATSDYVMHEREETKYSKFFFLDLRGTYRLGKTEYAFSLTRK